MNWDDPQYLWRELLAATEYNRRFLGENYEQDRKRFAGMGFRDDWSTEDPDLENHAFEWFSLFAGYVLNGPPQVRATTPRSGHMREVIRAAQLAINGNLIDTQAIKLNEACLYDWGFRWAVGLTLQEDSPGDYSDWRDQTVFRPYTKRISPGHFVSDPLSVWQDEDRFRGHGMVRDKASLIEEAEDDASWNLELLRALPEEIGVGDMRRLQSRSVGTPVRGEVTFYEVWVPEYQLDEAIDADGGKFQPLREDGYHGTIFTIPHGGGGDAREEVERALEARPEHLRRPRPFYGPPTGPYTVSGAYIVPDENRHLSPITAVAAQTDELNAHRRVMSRRMAEYKRGVAVDESRVADLGEKIKEFRDSGVFGVEGVEDLNRVLKVIEMGGLAELDITHYSLLRDTLQRVSGTTDAERGSLDPNVKATVAVIGNQASSRRSGHLVNTFANHFVLGYVQNQAWYFLRDDRVKRRLGAEASMLFHDPVSGEPIEEVVWVGGDVDPGDVRLKIDLGSMTQTGEEAAALKAQQVDQIMVTTLPLARAYPEWDWESYYRWRGEELELPQLAMWWSGEKARQMQALEIAMATGQPGDASPAHPERATPRLPSDVQPGAIPGQMGGAMGGMAAPAGRSGSGQAAGARGGSGIELQEVGA